MDVKLDNNNDNCLRYYPIYAICHSSSVTRLPSDSIFSAFRTIRRQASTAALSSCNRLISVILSESLPSGGVFSIFLMFCCVPTPLSP
ncbi:hypothetical protein I7I50_09620 [Histoplasma capsulatum G186AR]|uniref:Uncharacterized protein n=1 Tax=Ajellomyces capsulatus TaxID=5037 RepID=A0A8H7YVQ0_AJECA|nr:hypothetical protein I7I52_07150 [Histoplasma capsulatum]QSS74441.1 hypothetical protein I7I50_09620 [Histoplasma capsulatum G186AR]